MVNKKKGKNQQLQSKLSEGFYKLFFENSEEAVLVLTLEGDILAANDAAGKLLDYPEREMQRKILGDLFFDAQQYEQFFTELRNGESVNRQMALLKKRKGGTCRGFISLRSIIDEAGRPSLIVAIFSRKSRSESMLQKERNFISAILETTGALVVLLDPQYRFIRINHAFEKLTGYSIIDLLGIFIWDMILPADEVKRFKDALKTIAVNPPPLEHRCRITAMDGREYTVIWNITVMAGEDSQPEFLICTGIDITELQEALSKIKILSGFLPICSFCKKIRDDRGYWESLEEYICSHSEAKFSHGLCPECRRIHYPEISGK